MKTIAKKGFRYLSPKGVAATPLLSLVQTQWPIARLLGLVHQTTQGSEPSLGASGFNIQTST